MEAGLEFKNPAYIQMELKVANDNDNHFTDLHVILSKYTPIFVLDNKFHPPGLVDLFLV